MSFSGKIEQAAFRATGSFRAPCQKVGDLLNGRETKTLGEVRPTYLPGVEPGDLCCCLPDFVIDNYRLALPLGRRASRLRLGRSAADRPGNPFFFSPAHFAQCAAGKPYRRGLSAGRRRGLRGRYRLRSSRRPLCRDDV
ncbi:MAG: FAD-dependent protein [Lachnospiraceae bacterium]